MSKLDTEIYDVRTEVLGVENVDFALKEQVFIRIQVINRGTAHKMPGELIDQIAELVRKYEEKKELV